MELALVRSLMDKDFYDDHRGARCPNRLFSKDVRKVKEMLDLAIDKYNRDVTPDEVEALFMSNNPSMTTAQKVAYGSMFAKIKKEESLGKDVAQDVLAKLFQQIIGEDIANLGFDYVNGTKASLEPLRNILEQYGDDFTPNLNIEWDDIEIKTLLDKNDLEARWTFNIPSLCRKVEGINAGHLIEIGARPNTGKTSFHASLIASPNGFAHQGAKCIVLCNEEGSHRVGARYLTSATGMTLHQVRNDPKKAQELYSKVKDNIKIKDSSMRDMNWVESVVKSYKPDVVVLDMGDKFATTQGYARADEALKACAVHARQIAKQYNCAMLYMSQLSAEAEGKIILNQSMMEGSRTGKAAEADLMILIAKNPPVEGQDGEDAQRHLNIVKNKLSGWHGNVHCELDYKTARYIA
jgi:KaiC/GvpD/RAD55 family RecA-like ATPase|tara:strand:- start:1280 stop:2503 length:1224 start_codon:yes stop_codon:yes gene_type:complete